MVHAETDELLEIDRIVRTGLEVRAGQTIRERAREIDAQTAHTEKQIAAARAVLAFPEGWDGMRAAAEVLRPSGVR